MPELKAYYVEDRDGYRDFATVVFARTRNEARVLAMRTNACEDLSYTEIRAIRSKELDNSYRGRLEMDWNDPQDRIDCVKLAGMYCSYETDPKCGSCPARDWCERYKDDLESYDRIIRSFDVPQEGGELNA